MAGVAYAQPGTDLTPSKKQMLDDASNVDNPSALTNFGFSAFTQTLIDDANAGDFLTTLGVTAYAQTLLDDATAAAAATTLGLGTGDSPTFTGGTYTGNLLIGGKLNVGNGALDDTHIVNFVSSEDVITEVMLHLEWNSPTPAAGDSNALLFSMYDSALNETEYSRFRSVIEDPTDGTEDGAMTVDVLNNGVLEQAVLFSHDEIIMNDNGADRNFIVKDNTTAEVLRITGGNGSIAMDGSTLFVDSANNRVGVGTNTPSAGYALDVSGNTKITGDVTTNGTLILDTNGGSGTEGIISIDDGFGSPTLIQQSAGDILTYTDANNNGSHDAFETVYLNYSLGGGGLGLGGTDAFNSAVFVGTDYLYMGSGLTIYNPFTVAGQVELTSQAASTDDSAMTKGLVRDFSSVWGDVYKSGNGETDTNNKLNMVYAGDRYFNFSCYTGTAAGDGQWTTFQPQTFGLTIGSGAKGQLRDHFSYKFKFDSNTVTNTDVDLWLIRGKTANATLPVASDVCFALKFAGEEDLMIAVYDGVTAHTTTIDVSTINSWFTNLASQQEFMWTWDGTTAKVYGRYRKPAGAGPDNDWSIWYTIGSLTPSGMSAGTTNLSFGGLHFLQHTPVTCTSYTKTYIIWDLEHTSHVIAPN